MNDLTETELVEAVRCGRREGHTEMVGLYAGTPNLLIGAPQLKNRS